MLRKAGKELPSDWRSIEFPLPVVTGVTLVVVSIFVAEQIRVLPVLVRLIVHVVDPGSTVHSTVSVAASTTVPAGPQRDGVSAAVRGRTAARSAAHQTENKMADPSPRLQNT